MLKIAYLRAEESRHHGGGLITSNLSIGQGRLFVKPFYNKIMGKNTLGLDNPKSTGNTKSPSTFPLLNRKRTCSRPGHNWA
jgi:hypothetical protein